MADAKSVFDAISALKGAVRAVQRIPNLADVEAACDVIGGLVNHRSELQQAIDKLKTDYAALEESFTSLKLAKGSLIAETNKLRFEGAAVSEHTRQLKAQLAEIQNRITPLIA